MKILLVSVILLLSSTSALTAQTVDSNLVNIVLEGNLQKFNEIVQKGVDLNQKDKNDYSLLMYAAISCSG